MTRKQVEKISILRAKIEAGLRVKDSEWPTWLSGKPKAIWAPSDETRNYYVMLAEYLEAMGLKDSSDANPAAIQWEAYYALERGERCEVCARPGPNLCDTCGSWSRGYREHCRPAASGQGRA